MRLETTPEIHCDDCGEVVHNHFDCPVCSVKNVGTTIYESVYRYKVGEDFQCEKCGATFILVDKQADFTDEWEWELVEE